MPAPPLDHEKLEVYQLAIELIAWVGTLLDEGLLRGCRLAATKHLDESSSSIAQNIAEGNGKRSSADRARFLDMSRGSALECAACLDALVARRRLSAANVERGKTLIFRIVSMLSKLIDSVLAR